jgi:hypothetical protein
VEGHAGAVCGSPHRPHPGKTEVRIYDYVDRDVSMLARMFEKRLRGYRPIGYVRDSGTPPKRKLDDAPETFDVTEARDFTDVDKTQSSMKS